MHVHTNSVFIQNYKELLCKSIWVHLEFLDACSNNRLLINRWHLCRLTDIGASKSENKGGPEQSECLCGFVGGWCTKKTNQAKVNWETSCVSSWELKLIRPCFLWSFHSQIMHPTPATLDLLCFTHMFDLKPAALYWSDKWLQCEQIASSTHLLPGLQFIFFHKVSFHFCCGKTKISIPLFYLMQY